MEPRVLLVEDDDGIRTLVALSLRQGGYDVTACPSAEEALAAFAAAPFDVVVADLMLGAMDGFSLIARLRATTRVPIIVVSALTDSEDIVRALETGADDYVTKPFDVNVLQARITALRRRSEWPADPDPEPQDEIVLEPGGALVLDLKAGVVRRDGRDVHVTITEFRLLKELAENAGRVLSRQALLSAVWEHDYFGDERLVDVHVRRLRTKVERDPSVPRVVHTVRGQGYRVDLPQA